MKKIILVVSALISLAINAQEKFLLERPASEGNSIKTILNGEELEREREALILSAKSSIYMSTFSISTDRFGVKFHEMVCAKAKSGVDVRIIVDHRSNKNFFDRILALKECGAYAIAFRPGDRWYAIHEKLLIVDGNKVIIGGSGYSKKYFLAAPDSHKTEKRREFNNDKGWYDIDYSVEGQLACDFHNQFRTNFILLALKWADYNPDIWWYGPKNFAQILPKYYGLGYFRLCQDVNKNAGNSRGMAFINQPYKDSKRDLKKAHIESLNKMQAGDKAFLYAPYFVPGKAHVQAMVDALKRGAEIHVMTNSVESNDEGKFSRLLFMGMVYAVKPALDAGMKIRLWSEKSTLHRKGGVYGNIAFVGSDNLDNRAQEYQSESVLFSDDERLVNEFREHFKRDLEHSRVLEQDEIDEVAKRAGKIERWLGKKLRQYL